MPSQASENRIPGTPLQRIRSDAGTRRRRRGSSACGLSLKCRVPESPLLINLSPVNHKESLAPGLFLLGVHTSTDGRERTERLRAR